MPERLDEWPVAPSPYDDLLDGSMWKLRLDEYPQAKNLANLRTGIQNAGKKHKLKVQTLKLDETTLVIQVTNPPKTRDEADTLKGTRLRAVAREERGG